MRTQQGPQSRSLASHSLPTLVMRIARVTTIGKAVTEDLDPTDHDYQDAPHEAREEHDPQNPHCQVSQRQENPRRNRLKFIARNAESATNATRPPPLVTVLHSQHPPQVMVNGAIYAHCPNPLDLQRPAPGKVASTRARKPRVRRRVIHLANRAHGEPGQILRRRDCGSHCSG